MENDQTRWTPLLSPGDKSASETGVVKDPAAVALGKRRIAKMTPEQALDFHRAGAKAVQASNRKRSPVERRMSGILAWRTRRMRPTWMVTKPATGTDLSHGIRDATSGPGQSLQPSPAPPPSQPSPAPDVSELARLLDAASDEALDRLRSRLAQ